MKLFLLPKLKHCGTRRISWILPPEHTIVDIYNNSFSKYGTFTKNLYFEGHKQLFNSFMAMIHKKNNVGDYISSTGYGYQILSITET